MVRSAPQTARQREVSSRFKRYDVVKVCDDVDTLKRRQRGHGGFADGMEQVHYMNMYMYCGRIAK